MFNRRTTMLGVFGAAGIALAANHFLLASPTTLNPPPGPVEGTGRTLQEIYDRIGAVETQVGLASGPWEFLFLGPSANQTSRVQVLEGPVLIHSVIYYNMRLGMFDGATGPQIGDFRVESGGQEGFEVHNYQLVLDVVADDGLFVTFRDVAMSSSTVTIMYRTLATP